MQAPILVFEGEDLYVYRSAEQAASDLELVDVLAGIYEAFDARGFRLDISIRSKPVERNWFGRRVVWPIREVIAIEDRLPPEDESERLRLRLIQIVKGRRRAPADVDGLSIERLIPPARAR